MAAQLKGAAGSLDQLSVTEQLKGARSPGFDLRDAQLARSPLSSHRSTQNLGF